MPPVGPSPVKAVVPVPRLTFNPFDALGIPAVNPYREEYYVPVQGKAFPRRLTVQGQSAHRQRLEHALRVASAHINTLPPAGLPTTGIAYSWPQANRHHHCHASIAAPARSRVIGRPIDAGLSTHALVVFATLIQFGIHARDAHGVVLEDAKAKWCHRCETWFTGPNRFQEHFDMYLASVLAAAKKFGYAGYTTFGRVFLLPLCPFCLTSSHRSAAEFETAVRGICRILRPWVPTGGIRVALNQRGVFVEEPVPAAAPSSPSSRVRREPASSTDDQPSRPAPAATADQPSRHAPAATTTARLALRLHRPPATSPAPPATDGLIVITDVAATQRGMKQLQAPGYGRLIGILRANQRMHSFDARIAESTCEFVRPRPPAPSRLRLTHPSPPDDGPSPPGLDVAAAMAPERVLVDVYHAVVRSGLSRRKRVFRYCLTTVHSTLQQADRSAKPAPGPQETTALWNDLKRFMGSSLARAGIKWGAGTLGGYIILKHRQDAVIHCALTCHHVLFPAQDPSMSGIRNRFMATYRRDVLQDPTQGDRGVIKAGNAAAHHGDLLGDATLYERGLRADEGTYVSLYGLSWAKVLHRDCYVAERSRGELEREG
ncbi:MAG: hypothetical protein M1826_000106 [Phylliscum demangeonii]|nr:MAG: hypothetical protein M1826_000106 [Phylliscum demangeonii]